MTFREKIVKECIEIMSRDEIKGELQKLLRPFIKMIFMSFSPYIELLVLFLGINFVLLITILYVLLFRKTISI